MEKILGELPFLDIADEQLIAQFEIKPKGWDDVYENSELRYYLNDLYGGELLKKQL